MMFKRNPRGPLPASHTLTVPVWLGECKDQHGNIMYWTASAWTTRPILVRHEYKWDAIAAIDAELARDGFERQGRLR